MRRNVAVVLAVVAGVAAMWVLMQTPSVTVGGERRDCPGTSLVSQLLGGNTGSAQRSSAECEAAADRWLYSGGGLALLAAAAATTAVFSGRELEVSSRP